MKLSLGLYTQTSQALPPAVFKRALGCIIKPVFTYVYNTEGVMLSAALSSAMIKHMAQNTPEVNLLISTLAKNGRVEMFTSSYNQTILPLMPVKDRSQIIDRNTTLIRKTYGVRATSLWCYGQIWSPSIVSAMKTIALDRVVISSYNAVSKSVCAAGPFRMTELGKRIDVIPAADAASRLVSMYGQNEISLDELISGLEAAVLSASENDELLFMINLDQLCQGASYNREDDERLHLVFTSVFDAAVRRGAILMLPHQYKPSQVGYLEHGWYGRDASSGTLRSFPEALVKDGNYRYYLNRVTSLAECAGEFRKDRTLKKSVTDRLSAIPAGTMFLCDTNASNLRLSEHRSYYQTLLECEYMMSESMVRPASADIDDDGVDEIFCVTKNASAVFAPRGASLHEYCSRDLLLNVFDTVSPWNKETVSQEKKRSFTDLLTINGETFDLRDAVFDSEAVGKSRSEYNFVYEADCFQITKHYRMSSQNLHLSVTVYNTGAKPIKGTYMSRVYFTLPGAFAYSYDQKRGPLIGESLNDVKNVRFSDSQRSVVLSFASASSFSVREENRFQSEVTTLGSEQFYLCTRADLIFELDIGKDSVYTFNIITRIMDNKEKKNVFTQ
ncbi:MAG: hypothetical protein ACI4NM_02255 [Bullifex sp.]